MSDLHLDDGGKSDYFTEDKEDIFVTLLGQLADKLGTKAELILLGDILDIDYLAIKQ